MPTTASAPGRCPTCGGVLEGAAVPDRKGVIRRLVAHCRRSFDEENEIHQSNKHFPAWPGLLPLLAEAHSMVDGYEVTSVAISLNPEGYQKLCEDMATDPGRRGNLGNHSYSVAKGQPEAVVIHPLNLELPPIKF